MKSNRLLLCLPFLFLILFSPNYLFSSNLAEDIRYLSSFNSRMPGTEGNRLSADFIETRFRQAGLSDIRREGFEVVVPVEEFAYVDFHGERININSLWPNLIRTSTVGPEGLTGTLIYGGKGDLRELEGKPLEGSIVILDFDSGDRWENIAMLGPSAFVFVDRGKMNRVQAEKKVVSVPINVPRFYAHSDSAERLLDIAGQGADVSLFARMNWEKVEDQNIFGYVEGTDEELSEELIVIQSFYDSVSVVPSIAPGATAAVGIATLLELAEYFAENPPKRTVLFLATSSYYQNRQGMNAFVENHMRVGWVDNPTTVGWYDRPEIPEEEFVDSVLFVGLNLSDGNDSLAVWHNSLLFEWQRHFAPLGRKITSTAEKVADSLGYEREIFINGITPGRGLNWQSLLPGPIQAEAEYVMMSGQTAVSLVTVNDGRWRVDTPTDNFDSVNIRNVERQAFFLRHMFTDILNEENYFAGGIANPPVVDRLAYVLASAFTFDPSQSFVPSTPIPNAIIVPRIAGEDVFITMGVRNRIIGIADEYGRARIAPIRVEEWNTQVTLNAYLIDEDSGEIVKAPNLGETGAGQFPNVFSVGRGGALARVVVLFEATPLSLFGLIDPQYMIQLDSLDVLNMANSIPDEYGYYLQHEGFIPFKWTSFVEPIGVVFGQPGTRVKILGKTGPLGIRLLLVNAKENPLTQEEAEGMGIDLAEVSAIYNTPYFAARDMISLNTFRRKNFEQYGIRNERLARLQEESAALLEKAEGFRAERQWYDFVRSSRQSQAIESRAYPDVKATANDVVIGLIFYLLLLLPFAYFGERLIFGFPKLEKRIAAIAGIFLIVYAIMRMVHPGFQLTEAPEIILLAFVVLTMALLVIGIITGKFEEQMQKMKMEKSKVYKTDVGRVTATGTAFSLGVANMKRRKTRTMLTSITLILLTFTVLSFTSISTYLRFNRVRQPYDPSYNGLLFRDRGWAPILNFAYVYTESEFTDAGNVVPRVWLVSEELGQRSVIEMSRGNHRELTSGALGLSISEILPVRESLVAGQWFEDDYEDSIILPRAKMEALGLSESDAGSAHVVLYGKELLVRGFFDPDVIDGIRDLDNERITPADFSGLPERELEHLKMEVETGVQMRPDVRIVPHMEAVNTVMVPYRTLLDMKGTIHSVAVEFHDTDNARSLVEDFVSKLAVTVFVGLEGRTDSYSSIGLTAFAGLGSLIIPVLIAAMIVLNTMLGSVYERLSEIGTYSAVGLAPSHISALFLAESLVYAVLGAVGGYLIGQVVASLITATGLLRGLVLNYTSLAAVFSTIVIVITVILSTIYPARKASQMAVPDVTRKWVLPEPKGDEWEFNFPFTVGEFEVLGLATFLYEYFNAYQDISVGTFNTSGADLSIEKTEDGHESYVIATRVWLAPFDLGINQDFRMSFKPLGGHMFYEIVVHMTRTGGQKNDWQRLNRRFLDGIRKQFLIWRTVEENVKVEFSEQGKQILKLT